MPHDQESDNKQCVPQDACCTSQTEANCTPQSTEQKRRELLEKYSYKRNAPPTNPDEVGVCGRTKRRTCC